MTTALPRCLAGLTLFLLGLAAYWSVRLGYADWLYHRNAVDDVARVVWLAPGNAAYFAWLAELEEHEGRDPAPWLERAAELNPRDSAFWIRRGLGAEWHGDMATAERYLLQAARVDHAFDPRWTLANYYFRRRDADRFWHWARKALEMSYGDRSPIFQLCWTLSQDEDVIRAALPDEPRILRSYLDFLLAENHLEAALPVTRELLANADESDAAVLLAYCDKLLAGGRGGGALEIWNALCRRKLLPYPALDPERSLSLTNGKFASIPMLRGFDWRVLNTQAVGATRTESPPGLKFSLSGQQPEQCELLAQFVPSVPSRRYRFSSSYRTFAMPSDGLRWMVLDAASGGILAASPYLSAEDWHTESLTFSSGNAALVRLVLACQRAPGTVRAEGAVWLRDVNLELMP
jgi:tetratricopeptide (TPR) repeat protein